MQLGRVRSRRRLPLLRRGGVREPRRSTARCADEVAAAALAQADGPPAQDLARQEPGARRPRARGARRGRERRARVRDDGPPRAARRRRSTARCISRAARPRRARCAGSEITQARDYDLVGELLDERAPTLRRIPPSTMRRIRAGLAPSRARFATGDLICPSSELLYGPVMKQATIRSVCECQSKLEAILDENRYVLVGFAMAPTTSASSPPLTASTRRARRSRSAGFATSAGATPSGASTPAASFGATRILRSLRRHNRPVRRLQTPLRQPRRLQRLHRLSQRPHLHPRFRLPLLRMQQPRLRSSR